MSARGCIIYLLPSDKLWLDSKLEKAQRHALESKVPLAVVTCIRPDIYTEKHLLLASLEAALAPYNIPLIALLGSESDVLPDFVKSARPLHVYGHGGGGPGPVRLVDHPYAWSKNVIPVDQLQKVIDKNARM